MDKPMRETDRGSNESSVATDRSRASEPALTRTTGNQSDIPKANSGALAAWIVVPILIAVALLAGLFMLPGLQSNSEDKDPLRRSNDSEQSRPE
jgi:hypothetical protein